jgi:uncharacterized protein YbjT (DUF2867 family)
MNVLLFGATGMVGQGVLRECLLDPDVRLVQTVGRTATSVQNPNLREIVHQDLWHYQAIESDLSGFDACFFCLGVSSSGMKEADYSRVTYEITMAAAEVLCRLNPQMTFIFVSGAGTDSSERGRTMWARIKGRTENALMRLPFAAAYMFRPGVIEPVHGVRSKTPAYRVIYSIVGRWCRCCDARFQITFSARRRLVWRCCSSRGTAIRSGSWRPRIFAPSLGLLSNRIARCA